MQNSQEPHYLGHRKRLKQKALEENLSSSPDYEVLELLLFPLIPRRDVKPLAKQLLKTFGGIFGLLNVARHRVVELEGMNDNIYAYLVAMREFLNRALKQKVQHRNLIGCWSDLLDYLKSNMSGLSVEQFRVLFLNKKNILIQDEVMGVGTVDQAAVYPREIIKKALLYDASAIILAHNHPSGVAKPSKADIEITRKIQEICSGLSISLHDHVIVAGQDYYSFKTEMLI
jgi:DNA repair protein RadC